MPILKSKRQILKFEVFAYILCHRLRVGLWVLCNVPHVSTGKYWGNLPPGAQRTHFALCELDL